MQHDAAAITVDGGDGMTASELAQRRTVFPHTDDGRDAQRPSDLDQVSARVAAQRARPTAPLSIGARAGTGKATTTARPGAAGGACGSLTTDAAGPDPRCRGDARRRPLRGHQRGVRGRVRGGPRLAALAFAG